MRERYPLSSAPGDLLTTDDDSYVYVETPIGDGLSLFVHYSIGCAVITGSTHWYVKKIWSCA